jgi:hypothetical protein
MNDKTEDQRLEDGGYVETVDGLIFEVRGYVHPADRIIAFLTYVPDTSGNRVKGSTKFRRIYDLQEIFEYLKNRHPQYLFFDRVRQRIMQGVPRSVVKQIYHPQEKIRMLAKRGPKNEIETTALKFATAIAENSEIPIDSIGLSGSVLVGLYTKSSDVDLVIYGEENGHRAYDALRKMREEEGWILPLDERYVKRACIFRWGRCGLPIEKMTGVEKAKILHGRVDDRIYFVKLVKDREISQNTIKYTPLGEAVI